GADNARAASGCNQMRRDGAAKALMRLRRRDGCNELLARRADQDGQPEAVELAQAREHGDALYRSFAETDAGIEHDIFAGKTSLRRDQKRAFEEARDIAHDIDSGVGTDAVMHHDCGGVACGEQFDHGRVALQTPNVVGDHRPIVERPGDDLRLHTVDGYWSAERDDTCENRLQTPQLDLRGDRLRATIGPGGFRADIDDVGALGD